MGVEQIAVIFLFPTKASETTLKIVYPFFEQQKL
jgi:hypothetical protein